MNPSIRTTVLAMFIASSAFAQSDSTFTDILDVEPGGTLVIDLKVGGTMIVHGWKQKSVEVLSKLRGRDWRATEVILEKLGGEARLKTTLAGSPNKMSTSHSFEIWVPNNYNITVDNQGGDMTFYNITGTIKGKTAGGPITLDHVNGRAELSTRGGNITITDSELEGSVTTRSGSVTLTRVKGGVQTGSTTSSKNDSKKITMDLRAGDIDLDGAPNGADVKTGSGNISIPTAGGDVNAFTGTGNVTVTMLTNSNATIYAGTGRVTLTLPANFAGELELQTGYTELYGKIPTISCDWNVTQTETKTFEANGGTPQKYIRAKGTIGGGGTARIKITNTNGNIVVKKAP